jgi:hypothetical protein
VWLTPRSLPSPRQVVINGHYEPGAVLETHRLSRLLALGKCVVSETSSDPALDRYFSGGAALVDDATELPGVALTLVRDPRRRRALEEAAFRLMLGHHNDFGPIRKALEALLVVGGEEAVVGAAGEQGGPGAVAAEFRATTSELPT